MDDYIIIFCTVPSKDIGTDIARQLVESELVACVNIISGIESVYRWDGEIYTDNELLLVIKSIASLFSSIKEKILALHPYEVPEIVSYKISEGHDRYLNWISDCTG